MARSRAAAAAVALAFCVLLCWQLRVVAAQGVLFGDFHAFYCGASALLHGQNPYLAAPIAHCEAVVQPFGLYSVQQGLAEPAPFPGYAFVLFAPFAALPYVPAAVLWFVLVVGAAIGAAAMLAHIARMPFAATLAVVGMGFAVTVLPLGELATIAACALVCAAAYLRSGRIAAAVAALCAGCVLPHVMAPALLALFVWEKRARVPVALGAAALVLLDVCIGGPALAFSYFRDVLPAHAQSEIGYVSQYGLTWIAHALGASDRIALLCGNSSYAAAVIAGVLLAGSLAREYREPSLLLLVPPAFAVTGGAFMHYTEILIALPAAAVLFACSSNARRAVCACALLLLAVPWQWLLQAPLIVPAVVSVFAIALLMLRWPAMQALRVCGFAALYGCVLFAVALGHGPQVAAATQGLHIDPRLAQASWAWFVRTHAASIGLVWWIAKAPTWIGLLLLALGCTRVVSDKELKTSLAIERVPVTP